MAKKPDILFLSTRVPYPPVTGHFQRTYNIIKQLSIGYDVHFFGFYDKSLSSDDMGEAKKGIEKITKSFFAQENKSEANKLLSIWYLLLGFFGRKSFMLHKYYDKRMAGEIAERCKLNSIKLMHLDMLPLCEYIEDLPQGFPVCLTNHNIESLRMHRLADSQTNVFKKIYLHQQANKITKYEQRVIRRVDLCIAVSDDDKDGLMSLSPDAIVEVVPNGVDTEFYCPAVSREIKQETILWVGAMSDPYNKASIIYFCEEIFPLLLAKNSKIKWNVVGKQPPTILQKLKHQYPDNINLLGFVDDVRTIYAEAMLFIAPLTCGSGTKLKVIEAMGMGLPVVTTSIGAEGLHADQNPALFICDQPRQYAETVLGLIENMQDIQSLGRQARRVAVDEFSWIHIGTLQRDIYKKQLAN